MTGAGRSFLPARWGFCALVAAVALGMLGIRVRVRLPGLFVSPGLVFVLSLAG